MFSGADDDDQCVRLLEHARLQRRRPAEQLEGRLANPGALEPELAAEREPGNRVGATPGDEAEELLEQRARLRRAGDEHLPARLDVDAVDEQLRVALDPLVGHGPETTGRARPDTRSRRPA